MEFERIGKNTVQCHMTVEEMNEYGLAIEDFFTNQEKSRAFLEQLVERAEEEIGYEVEGGMISMQLMRMPDDSLIITFSDRGEDGLQGMLNQIQNIAGMIDDNVADAIIDANAKEESASTEENKPEITQKENVEQFRNEMSKNKANVKDTEAYQKHLKEVEKRRKEKIRKRQIASKVFCFEHLDDIENFASIYSVEKNIPSRLYKENSTGKWYLLIKKGKLRIDEYQQVCQQILEYAEFCSQQPYVEQYCKEHFQCVISKHAIKTIKEYLE